MPRHTVATTLSASLRPHAFGFEAKGIHPSRAEMRQLEAARQGAGLLAELVERGLAQCARNLHGEAP